MAYTNYKTFPDSEIDRLGHKIHKQKVKTCQNEMANGDTDDYKSKVLIIKTFTLPKSAEAQGSARRPHSTKFLRNCT